MRLVERSPTSLGISFPLVECFCSLGGPGWRKVAKDVDGHRGSLS